MDRLIGRKKVFVAVLASALVAAMMAGSRVPAYGLGAATPPMSPPGGVEDLASRAAGSAKAAESLALFDQAVLAFRAGDYAKATDLFGKVMVNNPDSQMAFIMRQRAGIDQLVKMLSHKDLEDNAYKVLVLAQQQQEKIRKDPATILDLIKKLNSKELPEQWRAKQDLVAIGEYAVPYLLGVLAGEQDSSLGLTQDERLTMRALAQQTLEDMEGRAVMPLTSALGTDDALIKVQACWMLEKAADARAIPALKTVAEDPSSAPNVKQAAVKACDTIAKRAGLAAKMTAPEAHLSLAETYYYSDPRVVEYVRGLERVVWLWDAKGKSWPEKLFYKTVPQHMYNKLMAERLICLGLGIGQDESQLPVYLNKLGRLEPGDVRRKLLALLIANNYGQMVEAGALASSAVGTAKGQVPAEVAAESAKRADALLSLRLANRLAGALCLNDALAREVKDGDFVEAKLCVEDIMALGDATISPADNALLKAVSSRSAAVRFAAAEALLALSPAGTMGGQGQVVANVIAACGAQVNPNVAVVTANQMLFDEMRGALSRTAVTTEKFGNVPDAIQRIATAPPFVNLLVIDARADRPHLSADLMLVRTSAATQIMPVVVIAAGGEVDALKKELGQKVVGVVAADKGGAGVVPDIAAALKVSNVGDERTAASHEMLASLLIRLADVPPTTQYPLGAASVAVAGLLENQSDDIRVLAARALQNCGTVAVLDGLVTQFLDDNTPAELRLAVGQAAVAVLVRSGAKDPAELTHRQRLGALSVALNTATPAEMRDVGVQLFAIVPPKKAGEAPAAPKMGEKPAAMAPVKKAEPAKEAAPKKGM
jgi:hypothetical protein